MKNITKIYKENYRHRHTIKYIREVVEKCLDPKFNFKIDDVSKTFAAGDGTSLGSGRLWNDYDLGSEEDGDLSESKNKIMPSYTVNLKRKAYLYTDCDLDDYIYLIECLKKANDEFEKKGLKLSPNTIDNKMDFDVIEIGDVFSINKDNSDIFDFLKRIRYDYNSFEGRQYGFEMDDKAFYRVHLVNGTYADNEISNKENIKHFSDFLEKCCEKDGFKAINVGGSKFNIYTKRQHRMLTIKEVLK